MGLDPRRVDALYHRFMADLGAALSVPLVALGVRLGFYRALAAAGSTGLTGRELALLTGASESLVAEWLVNQAAGGYLEFDEPSGRFRLTPECAAVFGDQHGLRVLCDALLAALDVARDLDRIDSRYRGGGNGDGDADAHAARPLSAARFYPVLRAEAIAALTSEWIPALAGVDTRLRKGGSAAELGCWDGWLTRELAAAYPRALCIGFDPDPRNIELARAAGAPRNAAFRVGTFTSFGPPDADFPGYDLVVSVDTFHAEPDPVVAAGNVRRRLKPDGVWMVVEPIAGRAPKEAIHPCGRILSAAAATGVVPQWAAAAAGEGGPLGARAGEAKLRRAITTAGFGRVRLAAGSPWHMVLEARP